jgi:K+-sensing histidine kinase KdpD
MKAELLIPATQAKPVTNSLYSIVNLIAASMEHTANDNKSFIVNDVPEDIVIDTDEQLLASVLSNLMSEVIMHTRDGCIRITAKLFRNVVLLHVKNDGSLNYDSVSQKMTRMQAQAEKLGGFVGFTSYRNKLTTIAFSFMNKQIAA